MKEGWQLVPIVCVNPVTQRTKHIAYGIGSKDDIQAHKDTFKQLMKEAEIVRERWAQRQGPVLPVTASEAMYGEAYETIPRRPYINRLDAKEYAQNEKNKALVTVRQLLYQSDLASRKVPYKYDAYPTDETLYTNINVGVDADEKEDPKAASGSDSDYVFDGRFDGWSSDENKNNPDLNSNDGSDA
jgi:hypothetical protein